MNNKTYTQEVVDQGLKSYLTGIFYNMTSAVLLSGLVAFTIGNIPALSTFFLTGPMLWITTFAPLAFIFIFSVSIKSVSSSTAQLMLYAFSILMGAGLSSIFLVFTSASIAQAFFSSAIMFASAALFGYTTNKDMTRWYNFIMPAVVGLAAACIINMFLGFDFLSFAISVVTILIFTVLTAMDMQQAKYSYYELDNQEEANKQSVIFALNMYVNLVNIFVSLLQLFGQQKQR
jgi:hypothetical protein